MLATAVVAACCTLTVVCVAAGLVVTIRRTETNPVAGFVLFGLAAVIAGVAVLCLPAGTMPAFGHTAGWSLIGTGLFTAFVVWPLATYILGRNLRRWQQEHDIALLRQPAGR